MKEYNVSVVYEDIKRFCDEVTKTKQGNVIDALFDHFDAPQQQLLGLFNQWRSEHQHQEAQLPTLNDHILQQINADIQKSVEHAVGKFQQQITHASQVEQYLANQLDETTQALAEAEQSNTLLTESIATLKKEQIERFEQLAEEQQALLAQTQNEHTQRIEHLKRDHQQTMASFTKDRDENLANLKQQLRDNKSHAEADKQEALAALELRLVEQHQATEQQLSQNLSTVTEEFEQFKAQSLEDKQSELSALEQKLTDHYQTSEQQSNSISLVNDTEC